MSQKLPPIPDPEQYWPHAEELLDAHFSRKRRRFALLIFLFLLLAGGSTWLLLQKDTQETGVPTSVESYSPKNTARSNQTSAIEPITSVVKQAELQDENQKATSFEGNTTQRQSAPSQQANIPKQQRDKVTVKNKPHQTVKTSAGELPDLHPGVADEEMSYPDETADQGFSKLCEDEMPVVEKQDETPLAITALSFANESLLENQPTNVDGDSIRKEEKKDTITSSNLLLAKVSMRSAVSILFTAGPMLTTAQRSANGSDAYVTRRDKEEVADILPEAALQLSVSKGRWDLRAGIGMSVWGETVKYSPYSQGDYTVSRDVWQPYSYTVTDTDSAYIYGMLFFQTSNATVNDTQLVNVIDSLNGARYDPSILLANGKTRHTLLQIPVEAVWQFSRGRIGLGVSAGLTFGFLMSSRGSYLVEDQSRVKSWDSGMSTQMIVQASGGLEVSYRLSDVFRFSLVPTSRIALTPVREPGGADKTYHNFGVRAGVAYRIR